MARMTPDPFLVQTLVRVYWVLLALPGLAHNIGDRCSKRNAARAVFWGMHGDIQLIEPGSSMDGDKTGFSSELPTL
ncbi:hypothetical protein QBC33DRAFT_102776 [Phialemonium atrogriseum]|uniref:Uncharacterized protein n=1 Tax=Phialemonium atrogriseum TaxID=1093897 RepID=A0AAJ0BZ47_9PEZI|nr:uncharacterized protein QBC33DRAFT_102776 [Phialemonium atrogriseum]KAK1766517.1 hypothetical protein QBC33DRAFT_102776 [Phialemonium atrogriseum]